MTLTFLYVVWHLLYPVHFFHALIANWREGEFTSHIGVPPQLVRKQFDPQHRRCTQLTCTQPKRPCWVRVQEGGRYLPQCRSNLEVLPPENFFWNLNSKFLLSGTLSDRKLTPAKAQNTTHFHSSLHYVHPARANTKTWDNWHASLDYNGMLEGARKRDTPAKTGWVATLISHRMLKIVLPAALWAEVARRWLCNTIDGIVWLLLHFCWLTMWW